MRTQSSYTIRRFQTVDREAYLHLFRSVFDARGVSWFRWKYEKNPYADGVPIVVAESGDELVGARSFFALRMSDGESEFLAFQPCDTMVHPDHRRQGLMKEMTAHAIDAFAGDASFFFNTPNELALPANLDLGWRVVNEVATYYRIERLRPRAPKGFGLAADIIGDPVLKAYYDQFRRERTDRHATEFEIRRHSEVPSTRLESLYKRAVPETFHAIRDETFYEWRFENPRWQYRTYIANLAGRDVASIVTGTRSDGDATITRLVDVLPLVQPVDEDPVDDDLVDDDPFSALLEAILTDHEATDLFAVLSNSLPSHLLYDFGFLSDDSFPLSRVSDCLTLVARPLTGSWELGGVRLDDPSNWTFTFAERDTS